MNKELLQEIELWIIDFESNSSGLDYDNTFEGSAYHLFKRILKEEGGK
jgi:hypothetical protein